MLRDVKELLHTAAYLPEEIEHFLDINEASFLEFDPVLGYIQTDYIFRDGIDDSLSAYTYELPAMNRKMVHYADQPCRIHTYGNSFTQCAQVSDGETWQEVLAAHLREPIRNFGVGGYGVYQAYRRALRTEATDVAADNVILNMWDDDHLRNIDAARWVRVGWMHRNLPRGKAAGKDAYPVHGFPWAHLRYDLAKGTFVELPGLCEKPEDLRDLVGDGFYETFKDDTVVHLYTLVEGGEAPVDELEKLAEAWGLAVNLRDPACRQADAKKLHIAYGLRSSMYIVEQFQPWAKQNGRNVLILLSYDTPAVKRFCETGERADQELVDFLEASGVAYVDCLVKAGEEFKQFRCSADEYIGRTYIGRAGAQVFGHYSPAGNFWFAQAIRHELVDWLDPKPPAYR